MMRMAHEHNGSRRRVNAEESRRGDKVMTKKYAYAERE